MPGEAKRDNEIAVGDEVTVSIEDSYDFVSGKVTDVWEEVEHGETETFVRLDTKPDQAFKLSQVLPRVFPGDKVTLRYWGGAGQVDATGTVEAIDRHPGDWHEDPVVILAEDQSTAYFLSQVTDVERQARER